MANYITDPNMGFLNPIPGLDPGPDYALNISNSLTTIGAHTHISGQGQQVPVAGLNINSDFPLNGNNLVATRSVRWIPQTTALSLDTDLGCAYVSGVDLYFNDVDGNQIRLTQGGSIVGTAGSITGLPSGTASASFAAGTFVFQSRTSTSALLDCGSIILRNNLANSRGLTLNPPSAMASNYSLTLPIPPVSQTYFLQIDTSGNMTAGLPLTAGITGSNIASSTITASNIASSTITAGQIASGTITTTQISSSAGITRSQLAAVGPQVSSSSGAFSTSSASFVAVTNQTVTLTTTGRPVMIFLQGVAGYDAYLGAYNGVTGGQAGVFAIFRDSTEISRGEVQVSTPGYANNSIYVPPGSIMGFDTGASAGNHTYTLQAYVTSTSATAYVIYCQLVAYEL